MKLYRDVNNELTITGIDIGIGWKTTTTGPLSRNVTIRK